MKTKNWINIVKKLSSTNRFSQAALAKPENVLEHSGMVTLISLNIAKRLYIEGFDVDIGIVLEKAILHDIEESETGDVSKPSKYFSKELRTEFNRLEQKVANSIFNDAGTGILLNTWTCSKDQTHSGKIVSFVDTLCALIKFHDEICIRGNKSMAPLLSDEAFPALIRKMNRLFTSFPGSVVLQDYNTFCSTIEANIIESMEA